MSGDTKIGYSIYCIKCNGPSFIKHEGLCDACEIERLKAALSVYADQRNWFARTRAYRERMWVYDEDGYVTAQKALGMTKTEDKEE